MSQDNESSFFIQKGKQFPIRGQDRKFHGKQLNIIRAVVIIKDSLSEKSGLNVL